MAKNLKNKTISIELDKRRNLLYDLNAFCELEEIFGDMDTVFKEFRKNSPKNLRHFLWAGLIHEDENLESKEIAKYVSFTNLSDVMLKVQNAMLGNLPQPQKKEGQEKN